MDSSDRQYVGLNDGDIQPSNPRDSHIDTYCKIEFILQQAQLMTFSETFFVIAMKDKPPIVASQGPFRWREAALLRAVSGESNHTTTFARHLSGIDQTGSSCAACRER